MVPIKHMQPLTENFRLDTSFAANQKVSVTSNKEPILWTPGISDNIAF